MNHGTIAGIAVDTSILPILAATSRHMPHGRREQADAEVDDEDETEVHGVDSERRPDRQQDRHEHDECGVALHHRADEQRHHVDQEQNDEGIGRDAEDPLGDRLRDLAADECPGVHLGRGDDEHDDADEHARLDERSHDRLEGQLAVDEEPDDDGEQYGDGPTLGRREGPDPDAAEHDDGDQQRPDRTSQRPRICRNGSHFSFGWP